MKHTIATICAYCNRQISIGILKDGYFSHGICQACLKIELKKIEGGYYDN